MRPDVRRDPDVLDRAAARLRDAARCLHAGAGPAAGGEPVALARRIAEELDGLAEAAAAAATAVRAADRRAATDIRGV